MAEKIEENLNTSEKNIYYKCLWLNDKRQNNSF